MKMNVKKWLAIIAIIAFVIFAMLDITNEFVTSDPVHYFSKQPRQMLLVVALAMVIGPAAFLFDRLSPKSKRTAKLVTLGGAAVGLTVFTGVLSFDWLRLWLSFVSMKDTHAFVHAPPFAFVVFPLLCPAAISVILWFWFYYTFRRRVV
jgi:hypothetical protein